jgi:hypothetical protein
VQAALQNGSVADAVIQAENVGQKCLTPHDWLLDYIEEELAFMRGADLRR